MYLITHRQPGCILFLSVSQQASHGIPETRDVLLQKQMLGEALQRLPESHPRAAHLALGPVNHWVVMSTSNASVAHPWS